MTVAALQKVLKTLNDPTRMRLLALLEREELAVQDLMRVLDMAQSTVSRHLGVLRAAGLLQDRREGTFVYYRFAPPDAGGWRQAWELARTALAEDATANRDQAALTAVLRARALRTKSWFDAVGPEWDALRRVFSDDTQRARALTRLVPAGLTVADIGTGTGILALEMARLGLRVIAIDHSERMLEAARAKFAAEAAANIEVRHGEATDLPLRDGEVDAVFAHMVLHYLSSPAEALREMARVVRPGGQVVIVDFVAHEHEWMKQELGFLWQGFAIERVRDWLREAGLRDPRVEVQPSDDNQPATFIATAVRSMQNGET